MFLLKKIDDFLNRMTMYRLVLYGLRILIAAGIILAFMDRLPFTAWQLLASAVILVSICYLANTVLAKLYRAAKNSESYLITALILTCILPPPKSVYAALGIAIAGMLAIVSKYLVTYHHKHLFNPAAFAAVVIGLLGFRHASWWVGTPLLVPPVILLGLLVIRKLRRFQMLFWYLAAVLVMTGLTTYLNAQQFAHVLRNVIFSGPLLFMAGIMLTEPLTAPATKYYRNLYALLIGVLFACQLRIGIVSMSPEIALVLGNIFSFIVSPKYKLNLQLIGRNQLTPLTQEFVFKKPRNFHYLAGQYMEWTLPALPYLGGDRRGNRRTFTIASSPTEDDIRLGIKFYDPSSKFKDYLAAMKPGEYVAAGQLAGDFTLHENITELVFIAGGIGITPFRSMLRYINDSKLSHRITLFYLVSGREEIAYKQELESIVKTVNLEVIYVLGSKGPLKPKDITQHVNDHRQHTFYISGPNAMVGYYKNLLRSMKVPAGNIKTDYFTGY